MITRYNAKELLNSNLFIKEPVFEMLEKIKQNSNKTIILTGGRGIGKSVVLQTQEYQNRNTNNQSIYTSFSGVGVFAKAYPIDFVEHYYELVMSYKLLYYLKGNYEISYEKNFKTIENYLEPIDLNTNNYIRNSGYKQIELKKQLKFGEITTQIIKLWKNNYNIETINLLIDRFDWTNNRDELTQIILKKYFNLFNKVIITTDSEINSEQLNEKGYSVLEIDYCRNIEVIKKIIETQIIEYNSKAEYDLFSINNIPKNVYECLIKETNGNISSMFSIFEKASILTRWSKNTSLETIINQSLTEQLEREKTYKKMSKPPKLYL